VRRRESVVREKRLTLPSLFLLVCLVLITGAAAQSAEMGGHWVTAWGASAYAPFKFIPISPDPPFTDKTIRMVVRSSVGGNRLRVRLSNVFGTSALSIGAAHIALTDEGSKILSATDRVLTFGGNRKIDIPAGAPVISDPIELPVRPLSEISISIYLPASTPVSTLHRGSPHDSYISGPGDLTSKPELTNSESKAAWYFLSGIEMWVPEGATTTVAFGDSITEGSNNLKSPYSDYPDQLAKRLSGEQAGPRIAVVNEGIGGNRILHDGAGISALARFDQDVLSLPGVTNLIVLEGINDIGFPRVRMAELKIPNVKENVFASELVSADDIIAGLQQIVARAHEHGIRVLGATIMPFEGTNSYGPEGEAIRQAVNRWIRTANAFDRVLDFDELVRDPERPTRLREAYDSGDHIHPNPDGYKAMADSISLSALKGGAAVE